MSFRAWCFDASDRMQSAAVPRSILMWLTVILLSTSSIQFP
jgi:hypothetical protein